MTNSLSAFATLPNKVFFQTQADEEKIVLLLRQHPITNLPWILTFLLMLIAPYFLYHYQDLILQFFPLDFFFRLPPKILLCLLLFWWLTITFYFFLNFVKWYYEVLLLTNQRILDLDLIGFLYLHTAEAELERVQDVSHAQCGLFGLLFNFGSVYVQTAGEVQNIEILRVPQPGKVHEIISHLLRKNND